MNNYKQIIVLCDVLLFIFMMAFLPFEPKVVTGLSILVFIAILWLTEALHISVTALLIPMLGVVFGVFDTKQAFSYFSHPLIFLFFGGFALAAALHAQGLDKAIASKALQLAKGRLSVGILLLFAMSALLSMWISNLATTAIMLPLVLGILRQLDYKQHKATYLYALLGIAYCSSVGGITTLVGTAPNGIAAAQTGINFIGWLKLAAPLALLLLPVVIGTLYLVLRPNLKHKINFQTEAFSYTPARMMTLAIFAITVFCWIFSGPINAQLGNLPNFDTLIAISAVLLLCFTGVASWKDIETKTDWSVLLLFGGGICLSATLKSTGTSIFLAQNIGNFLQTADLFIVVLAIVTFVVFLTEFASNTASSALLIPIFAIIAESLGLSPVIMSALIAISASCAFMLPVATPPNAIVFGSGYIQQKDMMKVGIWINLGCIVVITLYARLFM